MSKKQGKVRALVTLYGNDGAIIALANQATGRDSFPPDSIPALIEAGLVEEVK